MRVFPAFSVYSLPMQGHGGGAELVGRALREVLTLVCQQADGVRVPIMAPIRRVPVLRQPSSFHVRHASATISGRAPGEPAVRCA